MCAAAQPLVGLSRLALRTAPRKSPHGGYSLRDMTNRFPSHRMTPWRQRFLAIARELEALPARRREAQAAAHAGRGTLPVRGTLRGIRLGCIRAA